jgi:hypothetical protein
LKVTIFGKTNRRVHLHILPFTSLKKIGSKVKNGSSFPFPSPHLFPIKRNAMHTLIKLGKIKTN